MSPGATVAPVSCGERCRCLREGRGLRGRCGDPGLCISGVPQEPIAQSPQNSLSPACSGWSLLEGAASPLQVSSQCRPRLPHLTRLARQGGRARRRFGRWGQRGGGAFTHLCCWRRRGGPRPPGRPSPGAAAAAAPPPGSLGASVPTSRQSPPSLLGFRASPSPSL